MGVLNKHLFITAKPMIYLVNLSEKDFIRKKNKWLPKIKEYVDKNDPGATMIPFSGAFELKLMEMSDDDERKAYLEETKCTSTLDKIIVQGYKGLGLEYFFTAGPDEVKAWTIQKGTKAPQAAGRIHGDFEKGFIMAEVMKFDDFKEEGSEAAAKAAGKYRQQGKKCSGGRGHNLLQVQCWGWSYFGQEKMIGVRKSCYFLHHVL